MSGWRTPYGGDAKSYGWYGHTSLTYGTSLAANTRPVSQLNLRILLIIVSFLWLAALPYEGLWKNTYIDEHAIQPAQVTLKYEWANVFAADRYLASLEEMAERNASWSERSTWLQDSFAAAGLRTGEVEGDGVVGGATWAHVTPPRSAGTEVILLSANWNSREGGTNLRGIAMLLSLAEFLRGAPEQEPRSR
jgi:glycosylphosphatidylinositol transamidase